MPATYTVPPDGRDVYRHFVLPVSVDRKRWVRAWQFRPRSRAVHHIFLMLDRTAEGRRQDALDPEPGFPGMDTPVGIELPAGHFTSWQPGAGARRSREGMAWALEPGMDLVVQMHLQPLGRPEPLQAEVGFYFTDQPPTRQPSKLALVNYAIDLPAGATNVVVSDEITLPVAVDLLGLLPHSHYLCQRIEARARFPDGAVKPLFLIPDWDFNWQGDYVLRTPFHLPAGTRISVDFTFNNSSGNPRNPAHPPRRVGYGVNTTDEMAELWLQCLPSNPADAPKLGQLIFDRGLRDAQAANQQRLQLNPKDSRAMVNLGRVHLARRQYDEAARRFLEAAGVDAKSEEAHYYLGVMHRLAGRPDAARGEFQRAVEINPTHARSLGNLGLLHLAANQLEPASRYLGEALRMNPHDAVAAGSLGSIHLAQGRIPEAIELLTLAIRLDPEDAESRRFLEMARQRLGSGSAPKP
jgi:Flp pilus assembly protein TadD